VSGDPEQEYFGDGMVENIFTGLSRFHWLFGIARNSSFTYKDKCAGRNRAEAATSGNRTCGVDLTSDQG